MTELNLKNKALLKTESYIGGEWIKTGKTFDVINPATGKVLAQVADCGAKETEQAIEAAHKAFPAWAAKTAKERAAVLKKWYQLIMDNKEDLGAIMTAEQGKPLKEAIGEIGYGEDEASAFAKLITLALPGQCPPGGGANLWATDGSTGSCGPRS